MGLKLRKIKAIPAVEIQLSLGYQPPNDPGYEKPAIRIEPIFTGKGKPTPAAL